MNNRLTLQNGIAPTAGMQESYNQCYNSNIQILPSPIPEELAMQSLKLRKIGNSLGVLLPKEIQERLHVAEATPCT
jgi:hypothetical protein